ncbi:HI0074 family nucleotidyltransferase substrate-binding subunit [Nitrospira sp. M1]
MERLTQRLAVARQALTTFNELVGKPAPSNIERDAAIQRFEYTCEATWKAGKQFLRIQEGIDIASPKSVIRHCQQVDMMTEDDARQALAMIDDRNLTVHTYNEALANILYARLAGYAQIIDRWLARMDQHMRRVS